MMDGLTPNEAAERLGVPPTTIVTWLAELPIPGQRREGETPRLGEEALAVLEAVRGMRAYDLGLQTIRRHLEALEVEPSPDDVDEDEAEDALAAAVARAAQAAIRAAAEAEEEVAVAPEAPDAALADDMAAADVAPTSVTFVGPDAAAIADAVTRALAPVMAQLSELAGAQSRELTTQARLIGQFEADNAFVRRDRDRLAAELVEARARIAWLESRLDAQAARPWWKFWG